MMRKVKLSHKILSSVLALLMVFTSFPIINTYAAVDENLGQVSAITESAKAEISNENQSNIIVIYNDEITLDWSPKNADRAEDGWWVGIHMNAPNLGAEVLSKSKYKSKASYNSSLSKEKSFWDFRDSKDKKDDETQYITLWSFVTEKKIADAIENNKGILETQWLFDWNYDTFEPEQTVTVKINASKVKLMNGNEQVYPVLPGKVEPITNKNNAVIDDKNSANIVVNYKDKLELEWSDVDETTNMPRTKAGWWAGIKMTAPQNADLKNATYNSKAYGASDWSKTKKFDDYKDGKDYITLWAFVDLENIKNALSAKESILTSWQFDWNNDGIIDQTVTTQINPSEVEVILNKGNKQVYPATELGTVTGITGTPNIENDKTNSVSVYLNKEVTLQWSQASNETTLPRPADGWWAGIKMTAPQGADLENAKYKSKATPESKWVEGKEFAKAKDGDNFITLWAYVANEDMLKNGINTQWGFDWDNDGVYEQYVDFKFNSTYVTLDPANLYAMDENAPSIQFDDVPQKYTKDDVTVNFTITENGTESNEKTYTSGLNSVYYSTIKLEKLTVEEINNLTDKKEIKLTDDGKYSFIIDDNSNCEYYIYAVDNAGNVGVNSILVRVDKNAPEFDANPVVDTEEWTSKDVTITGEISDNLSGIAGESNFTITTKAKDVAFNYSSFDEKSGEYTIKIPAQTFDGTILVDCADNAGNKSTQSFSVQMDTTNCVIMSLEVSESNWTNSDVVITGTVVDSHSGVKEVTAVLDGAHEKEPIVKYKSINENSGEYTITVPAQNYSGKLIVNAIDNAGNDKADKDNSVANLSVDLKMDTVAPVVETATVSKTGWTKENIVISGEVSDNLSNVSAVYYAKGNAIEDLTISNISTKATLAVFDKETNTYSFDVSAQNYDGNYVIYAVDNAGNISIAKTAAVFMDTVAPIDLSIEFTQTAITKVLEFITFGFYNSKNADVIATLSATDPEINNSTSGVSEFKYSINDGEYVSVETTGVFELKLKGEFKDTIKFKAYDNAGNFSSEYDSKLNNGIQGAISDLTDPVIQKEIEYATPSNTLDDGKMYFNQDVMITFPIEEEHFYKEYEKDGITVSTIDENVEVTVTRDGNDITDFTLSMTAINDGDDKNTIAVTIPVKDDGTTDGNYKVKLVYTDLSSNKVEKESEEFVIDTIAPEITAKYKTPINTANGIDYYNEANPVGLEITVKEHNFDPTKFTSEITAKNIADNDVLTNDKKSVEETLKEFCSNKENWKSVEGKADTYIISVPLENADANYVIDYSLIDLALNPAVEAVPKAVTYDTLNPEIEISTSVALAYKVLNAITFGFFNPDVTFTVKVKDATAGIKNGKIESKLIEVENARGEFLKEFDIADAESVELKDGIQTATFEYKLSAEDYKNGVTAVVYDYSKNNESTDNIVDENGTYNGVVVDTKNPVITSIKYNEVNRVGDKYYYSPKASENPAENAVIEFTVDEEYFFETYSSTTELKNDITAIEDAVTVNVTKDNYKDEKTEYTNFVKEFDEINKKIIVTIPTKDNDGDYSIELSYSDPAGNKVTVKTETVVIDTIAPVVEVGYHNNTASGNAFNEKYFDDSRTVTIKVIEHNFAPEYIENLNEIVKAINVTGDPVENADASKILSEINDITKWTNSGDEYKFVIPFTTDANYVFTVPTITDYAKNNNDTAKTTYVQYDENGKTIEDNGEIKQAVSPFEFTVDKKNADIGITTEKPLAYKILNGITFGFFDKSIVTITVKDATSGMQKLSYKSLKTENSKGDAAAVNLTLSNMTSSVNQDGYQISTYEFTINEEYKDSIEATVIDNSGNESSTQIINTDTDEYNGVIVDTADPVFTKIAYNEINSNVKDDVTKYYYSSDAEVVFTVDEEYFFENYYETATDAKADSDNSVSALKNDVTLEITKNGDEYYKGSGVASAENSKLFKSEFNEDAKTITITIPSVVDEIANDGDFIVTVGYTDLADHYVEVTTDTIVIDTTAPIVTVSYDNNEVSENALNDTYFNANRTATITMVEHNFAPEYIASKITAVDVNGKDVTTKAAEALAGITTKGNWTQDEEDKNTYTYVIEYSDDANYTFELASAKDYALNEMNPENENKVIYAENTVSPEGFVIDKVAPSENVKYTITNEKDNSLKKVLNVLTFGIFFNSKVDIKVETTDVTAGLYKAILSIKNIDGNVIDNLSIDGSGIFTLKNDKSNGDTIFTVDVSQLDEFRGKLYIDIYDKAGNHYQNYQVDDTVNEIVKVDGQITVNNKVVDNNVDVIDNIEQYESIDFHKEISSIDISYTSAVKSVVIQSSPAKNAAKSLVKEKVNLNAVTDKNMCAENVPLFNTNVPISINVTDNSSGISVIDIFVFDANENREIATYNTVIRNDGKITSKSDKVFENVQNSEWSLKQDENGLTVSASKNITIKSNYNDIVVLVQLTDNAGNISYDYYQFGIDKTAPVLSAVFNDSVSAQNSVYYNEKRTLTLTVAERDFINSGKSVEFTYRYQGNPEKYVIAANKFRQLDSSVPVYKDNKTYSYTIDIFTNDGEYADFEFLAVDRANNKKSSNESIIRSANNNMFRYDHIAPEITIVSDEHGRNENTKFYQDSRVITVSVKDRYATDSPNQSYIVRQIANLTGFKFTDSESGQAYHTDNRILTYVFTFQTGTSIDCNLLFNRISDLAGNITGNVPAVANANDFVVDGKTPNNFSATVVEDNHPAVDVLNQSDYKVFVGDNITLTITCEDENLSLANISNAKLVCAALTSNGKTTEQNFDVQKVSSSNRNKLTYSISNLDYDGFYDLSFTATDDSGKISSTQNVKFALCRNGALYSKNDIETIQNHGAFNANSISEISFNQYSAEAGTSATLSISSKNGSLGFKSRVLVEGVDYTITGGNTRDNDLNCYRSIYQLTPNAFMMEDGRILDGVYLITITPNNTESANGQKSEDAQSTSFEVTLDATNPVISNVSTSYKTSYGSKKTYEFSQDDKKTLFTSGIVLNFNISDTFSGINKDTLMVTWGDETEPRTVKVNEDGTCSIELNSTDTKNGNVVNILVEDNAGNDIEYSFNLTIDNHFWIYVAIAAFILIALFVIVILVIKAKKSKKDE